MGLCWQALIMGPDPTFWPTAHAGTWLLLPLSLAWVSWLLLLVGSIFRRLSLDARLPLKAANVLLLLVAGIGMLLQTASQGALAQGFAPGASLINLGVGLAGMLLPSVLARWAIIAAVLAELAIVVATWQADGASARDAGLYPLYAAAIGAAAMGAREALFRAASRHQGALVELRQARVRSAAVARIRRELSRQERLIHESVLNTLAAIARGGLPAGSPGTQDEAAVSAMVLRAITDESVADLAPATGDLVQDLGPRLDHLRSCGVDARMEFPEVLVGDARTLITPEGYDGLLVGIREALTNIERHARASTAVLIVDEVPGRRRGSALQVTVSDDGVGFDPSAQELRFGLRESIDGTMAEIGGSAEVDSVAGRGTSIRLRVPIHRPARQEWWRNLAQEEDGSHEASGSTIPMSNAAFARPVLAWFGAFVLGSALATIALEERPVLTLAALLLVGVLGIGLWVLSARPSLPIWFIALAAITAPGVYRLQVAGMGQAPISHWEDWSSEALAAFWLVMTAVGPWWTVLAALASWLVTQQNTYLELLQPGTAIILAGAVFARSVRRNNRAFAEAEAQRTEQLAGVVADAQGLGRMRARHDLLAESGALDLLQGVADGRLDPGHEEVQRACGQEERFIRSVMRLDPAADLVHRRAGQAAVRAHRRGLGLDISLDDTQGWPPQVCERFFAEVDRMVGLADARTAARLTARREGDALVMRFVAGDGLEAIEVRHA